MIVHQLLSGAGPVDAVTGQARAYRRLFGEWGSGTYSPSTRAAGAEAQRRLQFRNRYLMWWKNETAAGLARDLPHIALYEVLALGHVLLRERHLLRAYADAARGLPG